jgi:nucleoside 2-deoxyribosyltransferase
MGRLYGSRCYLAGPMDRVKDHGEGWRKDLSPFLKSKGIVTLDPCDKKINIGLENIEDRERRKHLKSIHDYDTLSKEIKLLRIVDLNMVDNATFLIVNFDTETPMCGTMEEIFWANRLKRPILLMCPAGKDSIYDWMYGVLPHSQFFNSWEEIKAYIEFIDKGNKEDVMKEPRWLFFDWKELLPEPQPKTSLEKGLEVLCGGVF